MTKPSPGPPVRRLLLDELEPWDVYRGVDATAGATGFGSAGRQRSMMCPPESSATAKDPAGSVSSCQPTRLLSSIMTIELEGRVIFLASPSGLESERSLCRRTVIEYNEDFAYDLGVAFI